MAIYTALAREEDWVNNGKYIYSIYCLAFWEAEEYEVNIPTIYQANTRWYIRCISKRPLQKKPGEAGEAWLVARTLASRYLLQESDNGDRY